MSITITNTYGTAHHVSDTNPAHVTSCDRYRLPLVGTIAPGNPGYEDMVEILKDNGHDTRPEGYGLIFLESEEFSATYFGSIAQIEQCKRENVDGNATFDASQGVLYAQWPHGKGWDDFLPRVFWNQAQLGAIADGLGLVTAFAHTETPGAEVIVYEFEGTWSPGGKSEQLVTYHCTACHMDTFHDCGHVHENTGVGGQNSTCRPRDGEMLRVVNALARDMWGTTGNALPDTDDAYCATKGPCSIIRELRAGVRPPVYRA
ncbi:hypothetical protein [Streptomyces sp. NPDC001056]